MPKRFAPTSDTTDPHSLSRENYDEDTGELHTTGGNSAAPRIQVVQRIPHEGEVNRARYCPQNPDLLASKSVSGRVFVFDRTKHASDPEVMSGAECRPDMTLAGQTMEGYGLAWCPVNTWEGHVLSSGEDTTVCHWDLRGSYSRKNSVLDPIDVFRGHSSVVGVSRLVHHYAISNLRRTYHGIPHNKIYSRASEMTNNYSCESQQLPTCTV
jgi:histone-binding protein RBBP4